jgi:hypothetical protein
MMRNIIGQTKSSFNLREIMDNKKILIVNLSKGKTGDLNSKLLGMIFVMQFQAAAMSRANIPEADRVDFCLYVDEFQNFSTDSFATIMSEARKYHLNLIVANQFTTQLSDEIRDAVFGNMGTIVSFRIGQNDVDSLTRYFQPLFDGDDLLRIPNWNAVVRTLVGGVPTQPFSMAGLPPLGNPNPKLADALKQLSWAKYGRPKDKVEKEIFGRLATKEDPKPAFGQQPPGQSPQRPSFGQQPAGGMRPAGAAPGGGSFLDEWLAKRKQTTPQAGATSPVQATQIQGFPPQTPATTFGQQSTPPMQQSVTGQTSPGGQVQNSIPQYPPPNLVPTSPMPSPATSPDSTSLNQNISSTQTTAQEASGVANQLRQAMTQQPIRIPSTNTNNQQPTTLKPKDTHHRTEVELQLHKDDGGADNTLHIKRD